MPLIETVDLCQKYNGHDILKKIALQVEPGEVLSLIGPTGAGKTTLLRLLDLLETPTSGRIYFAGTEVTRSGKARSETRRKMAFVLQKPVVFNASVYDNVAYGLKWRGITRNELYQRVNGILETVSLSAFRDRNARTLSGGEIQRVAIARAIALEPELLLLDEPTANLDPISISRIEKLIANIIHQHKTTIIMTTHDMRQGQRLPNKVAVLISGEILQTGSSRDIFTSPHNQEIAEFVGTENIIDGVITASEEDLVTINTNGKIIEAIADYPVGEEVCACIRPEDITLANAQAPSSARNSYAGKIMQVVPMGPLCRIEVDCDFPLFALVTGRSVEELDLVRGKTIYATFKATAIHIIRRER